MSIDRICKFTSVIADDVDLFGIAQIATRNSGLTVFVRSPNGAQRAIVETAARSFVRGWDRGRASVEQKASVWTLRCRFPHPSTTTATMYADQFHALLKALLEQLEYAQRGLTDVLPGRVKRIVATQPLTKPGLQSMLTSSVPGEFHISGVQSTEHGQSVFRLHVTVWNRALSYRHILRQFRRTTDATLKVIPTTRTQTDRRYVLSYAWPETRTHSEQRHLITELEKLFQRSIARRPKLPLPTTVR